MLIYERQDQRLRELCAQYGWIGRVRVKVVDATEYITISFFGSQGHYMERVPLDGRTVIEASIEDANGEVVFFFGETAYVEAVEYVERYASWQQKQS